MPIQLKTPYQPGSADKDCTEGYPQLCLTHFVHNPLLMTVQIQYEFGTASGKYYETWTRGPGAPTQTLDVSAADVLGMWGQNPNQGESVGVAMRRLTYTFLINSGIADGAIVDAPPLPPPADDAANGAPAGD